MRRRTNHSDRPSRTCLPRRYLHSEHTVSKIIAVKTSSPFPEATPLKLHHPFHQNHLQIKRTHLQTNSGEGGLIVEEISRDATFTVHQGRATFSERGPDETFRSSSWAGVTNKNTKMRMYVLQYFYCKAGKSVRRLVLPPLRPLCQCPARLMSTTTEECHCDGDPRAGSEGETTCTSCWRRAVRNSRCRQIWLRCVEHAQCI